MRDIDDIIQHTDDIETRKLYAYIKEYAEKQHEKMDAKDQESDSNFRKVHLDALLDGKPVTFQLHIGNQKVAASE